MQPFAPIPALVGGALLGLAASLLLLSHGRIASVSGIYGGLFTPGAEDRRYRLSFVAGLLFAGLGLAAFAPGALPLPGTGPLWLVAIAGLLVGYGTRLGSGCTSGHGLCGIARLSVRSIVATLTFTSAAIVTVFVGRHLFGFAGVGAAGVSGGAP